MKEFGRREFLRMSAMTVAGVAVAACARTPEPTASSQDAPATAPETTIRVVAIRGENL